MILPCLTLSNIRYVSKVKCSSPGKGVVLSPTLRCSSYYKGSLLVALRLRSPTLLYYYLMIVSTQMVTAKSIRYYRVICYHLSLSDSNNLYTIGSSCHATSLDLRDTLLQPLCIIHRSRLISKAISCISTELLHVDSSWSPCLCSSMWRGPGKYVTYEFVFTPPAVSACLVRLIFIVFVMGSSWPYRFYFLGCCLRDLFNIAGSIIV